MENVIILGSGCAGLTAAIYTARANMNPLIITGKESGGQLMLTTEVENYPGFPEGVQGPDLIKRMEEQAKKFGARIEYAHATAVKKLDDGSIEVQTSEGTYQAKTLIAATGASARWLGIESEKKFKGRGVHTCATCDGFFYKDKEIIVVGGGDSAAEESTFLTKFAKKVYVVHRRDQLRASKIMAERMLKNPKIEMIWNSTIEEIHGEEKVTSVTLEDTKNGETRQMPIDGIFLAIGHIPNTGFLKGVCDMDDHGFLKTDRRTRTNVEGIFAAGDVQDTIYKQAITASGSGCQAAIEAERYVESQ